MRPSRSLLAAAFLLAGVASAQPVTYAVQIAARTPSTTPLAGTGAIDVVLWLSDPGDPVASSLLFGIAQGAPAPFVLGSLGPGQATSLPSPVDGMATAPGVVVNGSRHTLVAVASGGSVTLGTLTGGAFSTVASGITGNPPLALGTKPDGGATLLVWDSTATSVTRFDVAFTSPGASVLQGLTISPLTEPARSLFLDGARDRAVIGGSTLGNLYLLDARLDAGPSTLLDSALVSQGRLAPPVTGVTVYQGQGAQYLLVTSAQGVTVYDLLLPNPLPGAFRLLPSDDAGSLTGPTGVALTNLPAGATFPAGAIALGDPTARGLVLVRWDAVAAVVDGGLVIDTTTDPRGLPNAPDGGGTDAGPSDGGGGGSQVGEAGAGHRPRASPWTIPRAARPPPALRHWRGWRCWPCCSRGGANAADPLAPDGWCQGGLMIILDHALQGDARPRAAGAPALLRGGAAPQEAPGERSLRRRRA